MDTAIQLLRISQVCEATGFCKSHIYHLMDKGQFPRPVGLGRARRWRSSEVQSFIMSLPRATGNKQ